MGSRWDESICIHEELQVGDAAFCHITLDSLVLLLNYDEVRVLQYNWFAGCSRISRMIE